MRKIRLALPSMNGFFTFEAAARCGSFARAAGELNVTPAAVSRMIGRLEDHIGTTLFNRLPGGVTLTEPGLILYEAISRGFSGIEHALREIEDRNAGVDTVTLSVSTGFTTHWIMPRMAELKRTFPTVELRFELIMSALTGPVTDVDLGMRFVNGPDERHEAAYIMPEILLPICSPGYSDAHRGPTKSTEETLIFLSEAQPNWSHLFFPEDPSSPVNSMIFSDYAIVVQAALLGQGVALGWLNVICHWLRNKMLIPASPRLMTTGRHCQFVRSRDKATRVIVTEVRDWIIARIQEDIAVVTELHPELGLDAVLEQGARQVAPRS
ncbi:LysR family transcriptional regulator [Xanthobacter sp. 126]|uniref:LysR family transcriptional regulator n=1 Tax=Xanthobacter sp. 126 TaxID=1131814 RepID=UPI00045EA605|nr:LysR family transcriptional regulator [Xanthobacter sp. 126]